MKTLHSSFLLILGFAVPLAYGQKNTNKLQPEPLETTVCKVLGDPSAYNNRLVKVRGWVSASSEYSLLVDEHCDADPMWLAFADGSAPPQIEAIVNGTGTAGGRDLKGRQIPPISVHLVRDANYMQLMHYLTLSAKGKACADEPPLAFPPDCTTYRVAATFTGRIDGVSNQVHEAHRKRSSTVQIDGKGFGHMGMFDAQIVVQSVENVGAVAEFEIPESISKPQ
jgi:hypothetical protein